MPRWKLVEEKFKNQSRSIRYEDAVTLLEHYGYKQDNKGKTSGSRVRFCCKGHADILLHRPHPDKELKEYVIKDLYNLFRQEDFIHE